MKSIRVQKAYENSCLVVRTVGSPTQDSKFTIFLFFIFFIFSFLQSILKSQWCCHLKEFYSIHTHALLCLPIDILFLNSLTPFLLVQCWLVVVFLWFMVAHSCFSATVFHCEHHENTLMEDVIGLLIPKFVFQVNFVLLQAT